ncbi:spore germination protein [Paenibacillus oenotherae]|uniref:Spore germination protein n=1 Tax=Paenibacillus oenotherae TaxID=1435645 RepID=A0ABS7D6P2_9BACL|nr:GerAB/ArcD/ProY family transporter [Paenibacillus oenotherae]MBW7475608.1 spore germination protein [Paenibacillus oenotherae]
MQEKLSQFHVAILIYMIQSGVVMFRLPQILAENFGTNGWLAILPVSLIVVLNILLIGVVYRLGKGASIFEILEQSIPRIILFPFYLILVCVWAMIGCLITKNYVLIFQMVAFPTTNPMVFKFVLDILIFFLLIQSIYNIAKASTVFFWLLIWMVLLLFFYYADFQWARLTPFIFRGSSATVEGAFSIYSSFAGYTLCLLLFPYANKKTKLIKAALIGHLITTINYIYYCFIAFGFYYYEQLKTLQFPILNLLAYIQLPFIQATENLLYGFIMFTIIVTTVMYCWSAKEVSRRIFPINERLLSAIIIVAAYLFSFIPDISSEVEQWLAYLGYIEFGISFGLPLVLIFVLLIHRKRGAAASE